MLRPCTWASEGGQTLALPWILKILAKKIVFLVLSGKKQILPLLATLEKFWKNPLVPPLKNPSDGHIHVGPLGLYQRSSTGVHGAP